VLLQQYGSHQPNWSYKFQKKRHEMQKYAEYQAGIAAKALSLTVPRTVEFCTNIDITQNSHGYDFLFVYF